MPDNLISPALAYPKGSHLSEFRLVRHGLTYCWLNESALSQLPPTFSSFKTFFSNSLPVSIDWFKFCESGR